MGVEVFIVRYAGILAVSLRYTFGSIGGLSVLQITLAARSISRSLREDSGNASKNMSEKIRVRDSLSGGRCELVGVLDEYLRNRSKSMLRSSLRKPPKISTQFGISSAYDA